jgi:protein FRA10AC1
VQLSALSRRTVKRVRQSNQPNHRQMASSSSSSSYQEQLVRHQHLIEIFKKNQKQSAETARKPSLLLVSATLDSEERAVLRRSHQFVRDDDEDERRKADWEVRMARKYYDKLFKEYAIVDLSRYETDQIGMRWRTEGEVMDGKGQFICGAKRCNQHADLYSYEVPFHYKEGKETKLELVKVRVCIGCAKLLFHKKLRELAKRDASRRKKRRLEDAALNGSSGREDDANTVNDTDDPVSHDSIRTLLGDNSTSDVAAATTGDEVGVTVTERPVDSSEYAKLTKEKWIDTEAAKPTKRDEYESYFDDLFF